MTERGQFFDPDTKAVYPEWHDYFAVAGEDFNTEHPLYAVETPESFVGGMVEKFLIDARTVVSGVLCGCWGHRRQAREIADWWGMGCIPDKYTAEEWYGQVTNSFLKGDGGS